MWISPAHLQANQNPNLESPKCRIFLKSIPQELGEIREFVDQRLWKYEI
jgi:hypothetical protein